MMIISAMLHHQYSLFSLLFFCKGGMNSHFFNVPQKSHRIISIFFIVYHDLFSHLSHLVLLLRKKEIYLCFEKIIKANINYSFIKNNNNNNKKIKYLIIPTLLLFYFFFFN